MSLLKKNWIRVTARRTRDDRGDVPGWVLITLMTAGLVAMLLAIARPELASLFREAMSAVQI